jgi:6-pyruvoyltetrahydropterin/6-carboxytetrahydropterin synthase
MLIKKTFHFYAAHRNEKLNDKCRSLHGHTYRLTCTFKVERDVCNPDVTTLFSEYNQIEDYLKEVYDHALLISSQDTLLSYLEAYDSEVGIVQKRVVLPRATSVENLCYDIFGRIKEMKFDLIELQIQETETSTVIYSLEDWEKDKVEFNEVKTECECVMGPNKLCIMCGRSEWDWKLAKRRRKNEEQSAARKDGN